MESPLPDLHTPVLNLRDDVVNLTQTLCDIRSESGDEKVLADAVELALRHEPGLSVERRGNTVVAATNLGRAQRVILAGHLDTVPVGAGPQDGSNFPSWRAPSDFGPALYGRGTCDMKAGVAVFLALAGTVPEPAHDLTFLFYECEEVEAARNGLAKLALSDPDWLQGDVAIVGEPTNGQVEAGCNGTARVVVRTSGKAAHSARPWKGHNAIHDAATVIQRVLDNQPPPVVIDDLTYRQSLQVVGIRGGNAPNIVPDHCEVVVNYRFAPSLTPQQAIAHLADLFDGFEMRVDDLSGGALPGMNSPVLQDFVTAMRARVEAKVGWTDVARFAALGVPAVNCGPGDPTLAHRDDEHCPLLQITDVYQAMHRWLTPKN